MNTVKEASVAILDAEPYFTALQEPAFALEFRRKALAHYAELPLARFEKSDLSKRNTHAFSVLPAVDGGSSAWRSIADTHMNTQDQHPLIVIADGRVVHMSGVDQLESLGVIFCSLREAVTKHASLVQKHLGTVVPSDENSLIALQSALWRDGIFLYIPKNVQLTQPVQLLSVTTQGGSGTFIRNLIVADPGSQGSFLDSYVAPAALGDELQVGVTEVVVGDGAKMKIGTVQDFPRKATNVLVRRARVLRSAEMNWVVGEVGDGYTVAEYGSLLEGEGSVSTSHTIALGAGRAHMDLTARMVHIGRFSESDTSARGVMQGKASAVYRGLTQILRGASGANGQQSEKLLMLNPGCRADAIPMLLIDENDVKCGHAASVGQINEDQLFYLMSRGISEASAKRLIVWGFVDPILAELPIDIVRKAVEDVLERKMA